MLPNQHLGQKKSMKTQKDVIRRSKSVAPIAYDIASVLTGPIESNYVNDSTEKHRSKNKKAKKVIFDDCRCYDDGSKIDRHVKHKGNDLKAMNGDGVDIINNSKIHKKNQKIHKMRHISKKQRLSKEKEEEKAISGNPDAHDNTSIISLFKNNNNKNKRKTLNDALDITKSTKSKNAEKKCPDGPCIEAAMNKNTNFQCRCVNRNKGPDFIVKECTQATCKSARNFSNLVSKYSQRILSFKPNNNLTCSEGLCVDAAKLHKNDFICKCEKKQKFNECSDNTCGKHTYNVNDRISNPIDQDFLNRKLQKQQNISRRSMLSQLFRHKRKNTDEIIKLEHEGEQTGEPFFEIQVNPQDMCVLNPAEIKGNILKYGKLKKKEFKCICPSRGRLRAGEVCKSGACKRAFKNKQTNFNCWCDKRIAECSDATCGINNLRSSTRRKGKFDKSRTIQKHNKPLLEVQLDVDKMCVMNPKEIEDKIINNTTADDICSSGLCKDAALKHRGDFNCKCIGRKINPDITECSEDTCFDQNRRKKSKFCLFCTRICSKSENWTPGHRSRNQKRIKRSSFYEVGSNKLCRGKICTKSENLYGSDGLHLKQANINHLPMCDCEECKHRKHSASRKPRVNEQNVIKHSSNLENNTNTNIRIKPKTTNKLQDETNDVTCMCAHACECHKDEGDVRDIKKNEKLKRKKLALKRHQKIVDQRHSYKEAIRRSKLDKKREKMAAKQRLKEIRLMQKRTNEQPLEANFCTALLIGLLKIGTKMAYLILYVIYKIVRDPRGSWLYVRDRIMDPEGTWNKLKKWFTDAIMLKKLEISETVRGSDTLSILADHVQDSPFYQTFAPKGKTKKDQMTFEQKSKARKRRIRQREQKALYSCRHMLLTTLRKTPCLWVYHICPNFYPQCLSLLAFMRNFSHIMLFLVAFACWTPCILSFELCRACLCCFMCTH